MGTIYNLEYDFSIQNGQSIVFSKKNGSKLTPKDLNAVQLKMIQSNQIPHMLPLSLENIDLVAKLHYDISSKQKLITYFRDNKTTMNDYYQLFLSIINTIEESGSYMLNQNNYILAMEFLYIGNHAGDVYLTYLPINDIEKTTTLTEDMKKLLTEVAGEIEGLQGNEFKTILNYIKKSSFSISGLKKLLLELIALRSNVHQQQFAYQQPEQAAMANTPPGQMQQPNQNRPAQQEPIVAGSENHKKVKTKKKLPPLSSREKVYSILAVILVSAFAFKLFDMNPSGGMLFVSLFIVILALAGGVTYWKFWRPGVKAVEEEVEEKSASVKQQQQPQAEANLRPQGEGVNYPRPQFGAKQMQPNVQQPQAEFAQAQQQMQQPQVEFAQAQHETQQPQVEFAQAQHEMQQPQVESTQTQHEMQQPQVQPDLQPTMQGQQEQAAFQPVFSTDNSSSDIDTTLLNVDHDDTVLLEDEEESAALETAAQPEVNPVLTRVTEDEEPTTIEINEKNLIIGRNEEAVHFVDTARGVSRIHVEIIRIDGASYGIKDLGSKNGSKLNGNPMVPYKLYALNENDEIELGKAHYTFNWGNE